MSQYDVTITTPKSGGKVHIDAESEQDAITKAQEYVDQHWPGPHTAVAAELRSSESTTEPIEGSQQ